MARWASLYIWYREGQRHCTSQRLLIPYSTKPLIGSYQFQSPIPASCHLPGARRLLFLWQQLTYLWRARHPRITYLTRQWWWNPLSANYGMSRRHCGKLHLFFISRILSHFVNCIDWTLSAWVADWGVPWQELHRQLVLADIYLSPRNIESHPSQPKQWCRGMQLCALDTIWSGFVRICYLRCWRELIAI